MYFSGTVYIDRNSRDHMLLERDGCSIRREADGKSRIFPMQGYNDIDENGKVTGMDVEYLEEVCKSAQRIYVRHAGSPG